MEISMNNEKSFINIFQGRWLHQFVKVLVEKQCIVEETLFEQTSVLWVKEGVKNHHLKRKAQHPSPLLLPFSLMVLWMWVKILLHIFHNKYCVENWSGFLLSSFLCLLMPTRWHLTRTFTYFSRSLCWEVKIYCF